MRLFLDQYGNRFLWHRDICPECMFPLSEGDRYCGDCEDCERPYIRYLYNISA